MGKPSPPKIPQSSIDAQVNLQNTEANLLKQYSNFALPNLGTASDYWGQILSGGPAAQRATAPYAQMINTQATQARNNIINTLPAGGEKNLALAQLPIQTATNVAKLYQGQGPQAAGALQGLALGAGGLGTGSGSVASSTGAGLLNASIAQQQMKSQMAGGIGGGLGTLLGGVLGSSAGAASGGASVAAKLAGLA